mmetsp:Transcript_21978/g.48292  ORF Transcript_21978/g.48292 Transcript_21978/m.48292 type:complete len:95 (+) Transcript_21978:153-437(+)
MEVARCLQSMPERRPGNFKERIFQVSSHETEMKRQSATWGTLGTDTFSSWLLSEIGAHPKLDWKKWAEFFRHSEETWIPFKKEAFKVLRKSKFG